MNLKEIFDKAEGGVLNYDQFVAAATEGKAKFVDLSEGGYVDKQKYTDDLQSRDTRITTLDETIKARDTDLANLQKQLQDAGTDSEKLSELTSKFADLQAQYDKDTKEYQRKLEEQAYQFAVNEFASKQKFTSKAAQRDFTAAMLAKGLQMENGTILGASDFMTAYTKENADAFVVEQAGEGTKPQPHFVDSTNQGSGNQGDSTPFQFNFTGVRPHGDK